MSETSTRLSLPYIQTAQAQKELTHNAAIASLDMLVQAVIEDVPLSAPPAAPVEGSAYVVGTAATGDWAGHEDELALRVNGAWQFSPPFDGLTVWLKPFGKMVTYSSSAWRIGELNASLYKVDGIQILSTQKAAIADAAGGASVDAEARMAINALLSALRAHGVIAT